MQDVGYKSVLTIIVTFCLKHAQTWLLLSADDKHASASLAASLHSASSLAIKAALRAAVSSAIAVGPCAYVIGRVKKGNGWHNSTGSYAVDAVDGLAEGIRTNHTHSIISYLTWPLGLGVGIILMHGDSAVSAPAFDKYVYKSHACHQSHTSTHMMSNYPSKSNKASIVTLSSMQPIQLLGHRGS